MANETLGMSAEVAGYVRTVGVREPDVLARLRAETAPMQWAVMQISPEQGALMAMLVALTGARRILELGVFTGYSSLAMALALPDDGRITACDQNEEWTGIARRYWRDAGVDHKIDLRLAPALDTLEALLADGRAETYDFAFIDADKGNYDAYYEQSLKLVRAGGLIALDNTLQNGKVADPGAQEGNVPIIRALNEKLHADSRIDLGMVPIGDGLTLARKRP